jgi:hypothetical protein
VTVASTSPVIGIEFSRARSRHRWEAARPSIAISGEEQIAVDNGVRRPSDRLQLSAISGDRNARCSRSEHTLAWAQRPEFTMIADRLPLRARGDEGALDSSMLPRGGHR